MEQGFLLGNIPTLNTSKTCLVLVQHKQTLRHLRTAHQVKLNTPWVFTTVSHLASDDSEGLTFQNANVTCFVNEFVRRNQC